MITFLLYREIISITDFQDIYLERRKREEERRKAVALLSKKSPKSHHLTIEQRHYQMKIKELRAKSERRNNNNNSDPETDSSAPEEKDREREPRLTNITSEYDLKLFQEAQAAASEKIVSSVLSYVNQDHYSGSSVNI
jgi:histone acetyltransferase MYST2